MSPSRVTGMECRDAARSAKQPLPAASAAECLLGERWLLGAVGGATALALATVLALAAVVASLAAALAFAVVFAFTGVF